MNTRNLIEIAGEVLSFVAMAASGIHLLLGDDIADPLFELIADLALGEADARSGHTFTPDLTFSSSCDLVSGRRRRRWHNGSRP